MLYKIPTVKNIKVDLNPWWNIIKIILLLDNKLSLIIKKGITIIWATDEYATRRLKSDWNTQINLLITSINMKYDNV